MATGGNEGISKAAICWYYNSPQGCWNGDNCKFRHEKSENRQPCRFFRSVAGCRYGDKCHYAHISAEEASLNESVPTGDQSGATLPSQEPSQNQTLKKEDCHRRKEKRGRRKDPKGEEDARIRFFMNRMSAGGFDSDSDADSDDCGMFGMSGNDVNELLMQGIKPWEDCAFDALNVIYGYD